MEILTHSEMILYSRLIWEYEAEKWWQICSLDRFLKIKYENSGYKQEYYKVWMYAQEDF